MEIMKKLRKREVTGHIKNAIIGIGGDKARKSRWMAKLDEVVDVGLRFPNYGAEVLYRQACSVAGLAPRPWDSLTIKERMGFLALRALLNAYTDLIEDEAEVKPEVSKRPDSRPKNSGLDRAGADSDEDDPRARFGSLPTPAQVKAAKKKRADAAKKKAAAAAKKKAAAAKRKAPAAKKKPAAKPKK